MDASPTSPLRGLRVGVTATRKSVQLAAALETRGATVMLGPTLSGDRPRSFAAIEAETRLVVDARPEWIVASTGVGMRLWLEAAQTTGLERALRDAVGAARCVARGAKAAGGLQALGAKPTWTAPNETDAEVAAWLSDRVSVDDVVAVQQHGGASNAFDRLANHARQVLVVLPYESAMPDDVGPAMALIAAINNGELDLVTFTSPSAARNLVEIARGASERTASDLLARLNGDVAVASIGAVTTEAIESAGFAVTVQPGRHRTGDLLRAVERWHTERLASK